jgi:hypothetical protein
MLVMVEEEKEREWGKGVLEEEWEEGGKEKEKRED